MRVYNPMTVIRQTSRKLLQAFFADQGCLDFIDFDNDKLYAPMLVADGIVGMNCRVLKEPPGASASGKTTSPKTAYTIQ